MRTLELLQRARELSDRLLAIRPDAEQLAPAYEALGALFARGLRERDELREPAATRDGWAAKAPGSGVWDAPLETLEVPTSWTANERALALYVIGTLHLERAKPHHRDAATERMIEAWKIASQDPALTELALASVTRMLRSLYRPEPYAWEGSQWRQDDAVERAVKWAERVPPTPGLEPAIRLFSAEHASRHHRVASGESHL